MQHTLARLGIGRLVLCAAIAVSGPPAWAQADEVSADALVPPPELDDKSAAALALAGDWLETWGGNTFQLEAAGIEIERVLRAHPNSAEAHRRHGSYLRDRAMRNSSDFDMDGLALAERAFDRAIALDPRDGAAHVRRADVYRHQKRLGEAQAELERAEALGDRSALLHDRWADVLMDQNKPALALARCDRIRDSHDGSEDRQAGCAIFPLWTLRRVDELDAAHLGLTRRNPTSAWKHGNRAQFLLCWQRGTEAAIAAADRALALMDYGHARQTLAAALYVRWAELATAGRAAEADTMWARATAMTPDAPGVIANACHAGLALPVLKALRDARRGPLSVPAQTVMSAAGVAPDWLPGVFALQVQGSGRGRGREAGYIFLNSEADYRDPRNVTVNFSPAAAAAYRKEHGVDPDVALRGKPLLIYGFARQRKIDFTHNGAPTGKYYFQTHIVITDADQVQIFHSSARPPPALPAGTET